MAKAKQVYKEGYRKGVTLDSFIISDILDKYKDSLEIELRERAKYSDGKEEIVISIKF